MCVNLGHHLGQLRGLGDVDAKRDGGRADDGDRADDALRQPERRLDRLHPSEHRYASLLSWQLATLFIHVDST
eukprot:350733-Prymnesium_polylepis.1